MTLKHLFDEYRQYCKESGERAVENKSFSKRLRGLGYYFARNGSGNVVGAEKKFVQDLH